MIRAELEALTFEAPLATAENNPEMDLLNQVFTIGSNNDDCRRISSQNYSSDMLSDVFKQAADLASASTQETVPN